ncbi:MAG: 50S ribosomal protein L18 [Verrucomicrobiota bacterium]|nr:50S ribosomal protein L18 [Verrucomicrobiota bacterium]
MKSRINSKNLKPRQRIHTRIRKQLQGTAERPRLAVHFSGKHIYAQVINDDLGKTIAAACTTEKTMKANGKNAANISTASKVGKLAAERAMARNVNAVVFDRGGFRYHGKVKALADAAREAGLKF